MKCETVLARMETGNWFERRQARRHAARCDACASALRAFQEARRRWATSAPLSSRHQALWDAAARQTATPNRYRNKALLAIAGFALAASVLLLLFAWPWRKPTNQNVRDTPSFVETPQTPISAAPFSEEFIANSFAPLEEKLKALELQIDQVQASAEKRDAQFRLAQLTKDYPRKEANTP
jgi:hypothetical protein